MNKNHFPAFFAAGRGFFGYKPQQGAPQRGRHSYCSRGGNSPSRGFFGDFNDFSLL